MNIVRKEQTTPIWKKKFLTIEETNAYTGIGINKLIRLTEEPGCKFLIWYGPKRMIRRTEFEKFIAEAKYV